MTDVAQACLTRARGLIPLLAEAAPRIEAARGLPEDVLDAIHGAGLFRLLLPRSVLGSSCGQPNIFYVSRQLRWTMPAWPST